MSDEKSKSMNDYKKLFSKLNGKFTNVEVNMVDVNNPNRSSWRNRYGYLGYLRGHHDTTYNDRFKYNKHEILKLLAEPITNEKLLRDISRYLYYVSPQYKKIVNVHADMPTLDYTIRPFKFDKDKAEKEPDKFKSCYKRACDYLEILNLKHEMRKILTIAWREDVFYGYIYSTKDSLYIKPLDPDFCMISGICDGCYKYAFDFSYFDGKPHLELENFGNEFIEKYEIYLKDKSKYRWQELLHKNEFCIKISEDVGYLFVPFANCFPAILDIEDYKDIKKTSAEIENYKAIGLKIPLSEDGNLLVSETIMDNFYDHISNVLPENVGLFMTPVDVETIDFEKSTSDSDEVKNAVEDFYNDIGMSSLLFGGSNQSSTALKISLISTEIQVYAVNRQIERNVNRLLKSISGAFKFQITIQDVTYYNQADIHNLYLKDSQYGVPVKANVPASLNVSQSVLEGTLFMENDFLELSKKFEPLQSSYTSSSNDIANSDGSNSENNGRPSAEETGSDLSDSGEETRERDLND